MKRSDHLNSVFCFLEIVILAHRDFNIQRWEVTKYNEVRYCT